jgi:hypothetical protein
VSFLGAGLVAAAGTLGGFAVGAAAAETKQLWALDPFAGATSSTCGCSACAACVAHGANKLFANAVAAEAGRAHLHCNCAVVTFGRVDRAIYDSLFSDGGGRTSVDCRQQWVRAVLTSDPTVTGSSAGPSAETPARELVRDEPRETREPDAVALRTVHAVLGRVRVRRGPTGKRWLVAEIDAYETVTASFALSRQGTSVARRVLGDIGGTKRVRLAIPHTAKAGPARLRVRLRNADGTVKLASRTVRIPHA